MSRLRVYRLPGAYHLLEDWEGDLCEAVHQLDDEAPLTFHPEAGTVSIDTSTVVHEIVQHEFELEFLEDLS